MLAPSPVQIKVPAPCLERCLVNRFLDTQILNLKLLHSWIFAQGGPREQLGEESSYSSLLLGNSLRCM